MISKLKIDSYIYVYGYAQFSRTGSRENVIDKNSNIELEAISSRQSMFVVYWECILSVRDL